MEHRLIQGGEQWLPFARSRIKALRAAGLRYATQQFSVDGAEIAVRLVADQEYIVITESDTAYLESGIQDLRNVLPAFEETYRPAIVKFTPRVTGLSGLPPDKLENSESRKLADGDLTWSSAGAETKKLIKTVDTYLGTVDPVPLHFENAEAVYCPDPAAVLLAKQTRLAFPPSTFSGKLRLYVQALYGSKRTDYRIGGIETGGSSKQLALKIGTAIVNGESKTLYTHLLNTMPTTGILLSGGKYILVTIHSNKVTYRAMKGSTKAKATTANDANPAEAEATVLANLKPAFDEKTAVIVGNFPAGNPIAWGWHFNKQGDKASIVMQESATISGLPALPPSGLDLASIGGTKNTLYTATLTYNKDSGVLTCAFASSSSGLHIPYLQTKTFVPSPTGGMDLLLPSSQPPWDCYADLPDTPIYCYYDNTDKLVLVTVTNSTRVTEGAVAQPSAPVGVWGTTRVELCMEIPKQYTSYTGKYSFPNHGVAVSDALTVKGTSITWPGQVTTEDWVLIKDAARENVFVGSDGYVSYIDLVKSSEVRNVRSSVAEIFNPVLVIPFGDCSSVVVGSQLLKIGTLDNQYQFQYGNNSCWFVTPGGQHSPPDWVDVTLTYWVGIFSFISRGTPLTTAELAALPTLGTRNTIQSSLTLVGNHGTTLLSTYSAMSTLDGTSGFGGRPYQGLFEAAAFVNPNYPRELTLTSSYFGAAKYSGMVTSDLPDVPGYINGWPVGASTPTGWA